MKQMSQTAMKCVKQRSSDHKTAAFTVFLRVLSQWKVDQLNGSPVFLCWACFTCCHQPLTPCNVMPWSFAPKCCLCSLEMCRGTFFHCPHLNLNCRIYCLLQNKRTFLAACNCGHSAHSGPKCSMGIFPIQWHLQGKREGVSMSS